MNKAVKLLITLALSVTLCAALIACGEETPVICQHRDIDDNSLCDKCGESYTDGKDVEDEHTHNFTLQSTNSKYLASEADCVNPATYYFFCSCGEIDTETYESGNALGHNIVGSTCERCGIVMPSEGLEYTLKADGTYEVSGKGTCTDTDIVISPSYNGKAVTSIGEDAFDGCSFLTSVTIPDSVTYIGSGAFYECYSLTSVTIGDGVTFIGEEVFSDCEALISVTIGRGLATMGEDLFEECEALTTINYNGTKEEWKAISKDVYWKEDTGEFTVYCSDGNLTYDEA